MPTSSASTNPWWARASVALLAATAAFHSYRAATLAITTDEAFTSANFVEPGWIAMLTSYDANHHVLHSILAKLSVAVFELSPLTLRLPALLAGCGCLWLGYLIAKRFLGSTPTLLITCAWLAWQPVMADFYSLARGYSLAIFFLLLALWWVAADEPERYLTRVSIALGLSVASNLVFVFPAAALTLICWRRFGWCSWDRLLLPGVAVSFAIVAIPLSRANGGNFYFGAPTLLESAESIFLLDKHEFWGLGVAVILVILAASAWPIERFRWFVVLPMLTVGLVIAAHLAAGMPWPLGRTGVYLVPLLVLPAAVGAQRLGRWSLAIFALPVLLFAGSLRADRTLEWPFDAANGRILRALLADAHGRVSSVAAAPPLHNGLDYYRRTSAARVWPPVTRWEGAGSPAYLVLFGQLQPPAGYDEILRDPIENVTLYRRR